MVASEMIGLTEQKQMEKMDWRIHLYAIKAEGKEEEEEEAINLVSKNKKKCL